MWRRLTVFPIVLFSEGKMKLKFTAILNIIKNEGNNIRDNRSTLRLSCLYFISHSECHQGCIVITASLPCCCTNPSYTNLKWVMLMLWYTSQFCKWQWWILNYEFEINADESKKKKAKFELYKTTQDRTIWKIKDAIFIHHLRWPS